MTGVDVRRGVILGSLSVVLTLSIGSLACAFQDQEPTKAPAPGATASQPSSEPDPDLEKIEAIYKNTKATRAEINDAYRRLDDLIFDTHFDGGLNRVKDMLAKLQIKDVRFKPRHDKLKDVVELRLLVAKLRDLGKTGGQAEGEKKDDGAKDQGGKKEDGGKEAGSKKENGGKEQGQKEDEKSGAGGTKEGGKEQAKPVDRNELERNLFGKITAVFLKPG